MDKTVLSPLAIVVPSSPKPAGDGLQGITCAACHRIVLAAHVDGGGCCSNCAAPAQGAGATRPAEALQRTPPPQEER